MTGPAIDTTTPYFSSGARLFRVYRPARDEVLSTVWRALARRRRERSDRWLGGRGLSAGALVRRADPREVVGSEATDGSAVAARAAAGEQDRLPVVEHRRPEAEKRKRLARTRCGRGANAVAVVP